MTPTEELIQAIRIIERQQSVSGWANEIAWMRLTLALERVNGQGIPNSTASRLESILARAGV